MFCVILIEHNRVFLHLLHLRWWKGATALHNAAARGHVALVKVLLAARADPAIRSAHGVTALGLVRARFGAVPALEAALTQEAGVVLSACPYLNL